MKTVNKICQKHFICAVLLFIAPQIVTGQVDAPTSADQASSANEVEVVTRVIGIGGIFIQAKDPKNLREWYKKHLGIEIQSWGGASFEWIDSAKDPAKGQTAWAISDGSDFAPSTSPFMVNYLVADLDGLLTLLRSEGVEILKDGEESDFGKFAWILDPEGNKIELWEQATD